jgi:predicted RND superfamily exporter protein
MQQDNSDADPKAELKRRMAYSFRRSARAMSITSSTTAAAFFANLFSPIMPIRSFGAFSGFLIPMNFLLVVIVMPCAVIWWEANVKGKFKYCCCPTSEEER